MEADVSAKNIRVLPRNDNIANQDDSQVHYLVLSGPVAFAVIQSIRSLIFPTYHTTHKKIWNSNDEPMKDRETLKKMSSMILDKVQQHMKHCIKINWHVFLK